MEFEWSLSPFSKIFLNFFIFEIWEFENFLSNWELKNLEIYTFHYFFENLKIVKFLINKMCKFKIWNLEIRDWKLKDFIIDAFEDSKTYPIKYITKE